MPKYANISFGVRFGEFVKYRRNAMGLKQIAVAARAFGTESDQQFLSKIERGQRNLVNSETVRALCDVLQISNHELALLQAGYTSAEISELSRTRGQSSPAVENLPTRSVFFARAAKLISTTETFRGLLTGPFFCHPPDYYAAKESNQYPDTDKLLRDFIVRQEGRFFSTRIIASNLERYIAKVNSYIPPSNRRKFYLSTLENVDLIFGIDGARGPDVCCAYLGYIHISYIFDNEALVQHRKSQMTPTEGGDCITAKEVVERSSRAAAAMKF